MHRPGRLAQLVEHLVYTEGVACSSHAPPISAKRFPMRGGAPLPQRSTQRTPFPLHHLGAPQPALVDQDLQSYHDPAEGEVDRDGRDRTQPAQAFDVSVPGALDAEGEQADAER
jgi:hypothetical protein